MSLLHRAMQWKRGKRVVQSRLWLELSHEQLLPETHLCQSCERLLPPTRPGGPLFIWRQISLHPLGFTDGNIINEVWMSVLDSTSTARFCVRSSKFKDPNTYTYIHIHIGLIERLTNVLSALEWVLPLTFNSWLFQSGRRQGCCQSAHF